MIKTIPYIKENRKIIGQFIFSIFFIGTGIWFIQHEQAELVSVRNHLSSANAWWVIAGIGVTFLYILLQALMYMTSFAAIGNTVGLADAIILFLKRNFVSVFLPAGGISSLVFFTDPLKKKGIKETQILFASTIYAFVGFLSVAVVGIPAFMFALVKNASGAGEWLALIAIVVLNVGLVQAYRSMLQQGRAYKIILKWFPSTEVFLNDLASKGIDRKQFLLTIVYSILIELVGIVHVYIAMLALQFSPTLFAAIMGYIVSVVFLVISPFLRGLGAVEVSMSYVLIRFGFEPVSAISITFLYRFFEFWMPLLAGALSFLLKINKLLMRILPAIFLFGLGIINIVSVLTPAFKDRLNWLKDFLPIEAIHASNNLVLITGLFLLVTAAFMLKGLRTAWWFGVILSVISLIGHLTKAIDVEEASAALLVILVLMATRKEYYIKNNPHLRLIGIQTALLSIAAVLVYGIIGFYFLDKKHFGIDFGFMQSVRYTLQNYFLIGSEDLYPAGSFADHFLMSIKISGLFSFSFMLYTLVRPFIQENTFSAEEKVLSDDLVSKAGDSALDYFKTYRDKLIFIASDKQAFVSYRVSANFAVVLENPVAISRVVRINCINEFNQYCFESGLKSIFYRVPEESLSVYRQLGYKHLFLGQVGVVDLDSFSLEGPGKKSLRNAYRKVNDKGLRSKIHLPPIKEGLIQKLKSVSDEWLLDTHRSEIVFSQGMFLVEELKKQTIITVENTEEKIIAFLNIIPDYVKGEATYDLLRKTSDAPNGVLDFILLDLFAYLKTQQFTSINLGLAPLSGLENPNTFPEKSMKYAYEKIKSFAHYKGLRDFKDKFSPEWKNEYLVYSHDFDLLQVPSVLAKVIKP